LQIDTGLAMLASQRSKRLTRSFKLKVEGLHIGMKVEHPHYGRGVVKSITEATAVVQFPDGARTLSPEGSGLEPVLDVPDPSLAGVSLSDLVAKAVRRTLDELGVEMPDAVVDELAARWDGGMMTLVPVDKAQQSKEIPLEVFFHKIVMMRNNLRVLEQKVNAHDKLSDADKVELQQYVTRCYGSMTTFNLLFREREGGFGGT
jgi:hypothetical protein